MLEAGKMPTSVCRHFLLSLHQIFFNFADFYFLTQNQIYVIKIRDRSKRMDWQREKSN